MRNVHLHNATDGHSPQYCHTNLKGRPLMITNRSTSASGTVSARMGARATGRDARSHTTPSTRGTCLSTFMRKNPLADILLKKTYPMFVNTSLCAAPFTTTLLLLLYHIHAVPGHRVMDHTGPADERRDERHEVPPEPAAPTQSAFARTHARVLAGLVLRKRLARAVLVQTRCRAALPLLAHLSGRELVPVTFDERVEPEVRGRVGGGSGFQVAAEEEMTMIRLTEARARRR
ncbi:hypothetical protein C8Q80DRAFT_1121370 [Daedaleopsis nitida]|nr:hypothetical protein C8Q80DRAFT_1121370 [Daedaleopsis nitida]